MKFGHFDDANREYVITSPTTPFPWINYLGNEEFFGLISNTGGGYCFYKDAKFRRLAGSVASKARVEQLSQTIAALPSATDLTSYAALLRGAPDA